MSHIQSEAQFIWKMLLDVIALPYILVLVLTGKRRPTDLLIPLKDLYHFIKEPAFSFWMSFSLVAIYILVNLMISNGLIDETFLLRYLIFKPTDIIDLNPIPFVTAWFMHGTLSHLAGNVFVLMIMGRVVERKIGSSKTAVIYFSAGALANLFSGLIYLFVMQANPAAIGASGCIMGLVAAAILLDPFYISFETLVPLPIILTGLLYAWSDVTGILAGTQDNVGRLAHLGGFLSVPFILYFMGQKEALKKGLLVLAIVLAVIIGFLFFGPSVGK